MLRKIVLVTLAVVLVTAPAAAMTTTTLDGNTPLTDQSHIDTFEGDGVTSAQVVQIDLKVTVAEDHEDAGLDGFYIDSGTTYLRLDYDEGVERTVRFYVPSEYFAPRVKRSLEATNGGPDISLSPVRDGNMTAVSVDLSGQTDATYRISSVSGGIWAGRSWAQDRVENRTGWEMPSLAGDSQWQYIDAQTYSTASPARINDTDLTLQYQADAPDGSMQWLPVPTCSDPADQRVCSLEDQETTVIMSSHDSPRLRYKHGTDLLSTLGSDINDLLQTDDRAGDFFDSVFGGGA